MGALRLALAPSPRLALAPSPRLALRLRLWRRFLALRLALAPSPRLALRLRLWRRFLALRLALAPSPRLALTPSPSLAPRPAPRPPARRSLSCCRPPPSGQASPTVAAPRLVLSQLAPSLTLLARS